MHDTCIKAGNFECQQKYTYGSWKFFYGFPKGSAPISQDKVAAKEESQRVRRKKNWKIKANTFFFEN